MPMIKTVAWLLMNWVFVDPTKVTYDVTRTCIIQYYEWKILGKNITDKDWMTVYAFDKYQIDWWIEL